MEILSVNFIHLLDLTNRRTAGDRTCGPAIPRVGCLISPIHLALVADENSLVPSVELLTTAIYGSGICKSVN